ncbi:50S ribosomal protein L32 [Actinotalea sp. BY-33]|uniref:Large ribosomal subunit protein bL32 n=1 Tax=Actinotalea soli TaxID=2819234 RepID=A0A939LMV7_9CELL|nr:MULTISPECIES: 50S ribosomal protein L32 [Actinotalea]MBO1750741.1 50S ribosomal protein L32 [Actinotalea soli]
MAVPKRKMSRSNTRARRSQWKTTAATLTTCTRCSADTRPHQACPSCGAYKGRQYAEALRTEHESR